uniref:Serine/threonine-protein kinase DCLK3 n=1 Tax=Kryptolebias marmoratus TaxID=37003 RepID=A0A3Q3A2B5_KRYMA
MRSAVGSGCLRSCQSSTTPQKVARFVGSENSLHIVTVAKLAAQVSYAGSQNPETRVLPSGGSDLSLSDVERCYEIGRVIGDGNFAVVRECRRRDDGQACAVKVVERSKLVGREHMMQNELSLLGSLCHPRIVRLLAHHHTPAHSYLVMELVSGGDLFEAISERGKFSEAEAGLMVSDVSDALNYIHCRSIVHRDLKPENLLVNGSGSVNGCFVSFVSVCPCDGLPSCPGCPPPRLLHSDCWRSTPAPLRKKKENGWTAG